MIIARGRFFWTCLASSADVAKASKPRKVKKTAAAPDITPLPPYGKKGCQWVGLTSLALTMINKRIIAILITTKALFKSLLSLVPRLRIKVISKVITRAGKFTQPPLAGLVSRAWGNRTPNSSRKDWK